MFLLIPLIFMLVVAVYLGNGKYCEELTSGSDVYDAQRWAFIYGLSFSPIGFLALQCIDLYDSKRMYCSKNL